MKIFMGVGFRVGVKILRFWIFLFLSLGKACRCGGCKGLKTPKKT